MRICMCKSFVNYKKNYIEISGVFTQAFVYTHFVREMRFQMIFVEWVAVRFAEKRRDQSAVGKWYDIIKSN